MSVQEVFNEISLTKDESIWESDEDSENWNRKRIIFLSGYDECLFEKFLSKEKSAARKNVKLSAALLAKADNAQETSVKLKMLTQALMFCPAGDIMDHIYRARSRIYYNIDKISFCHEDINQIKKKMDEDKELLRYQNNGTSNNPNHISTSLPDLNKKYKNFTAKIEVKSAKNAGRYVVASEDILPGELIADETSIMAVPDKRFSRDHCDNCLISLEEYSLPCFNCSNVAFCSKSCREQAQHHSVECLLLDQIHRADTGAYYLALRLVSSKPLKYWLKTDFKQQPKEYSSSEMCSAFNLVTHDDTADRAAPILMKECMTALYFLRILQVSNYFKNQKNKKKLELSKDEINICMILIHMMRVVFYNCHEVTEYVDQNVIKKIGVCLNPSLALINHSCDSNYIRVVKGRRALAFATRLIKKGDQIYDSYSPTFFMVPRAQRLEVTERYNFNCGCEACVENWSTQEKMVESFKPLLTSTLNDVELADLKDQIQEVLSSEDSSVTKDQITEVLMRCYENIQHPNKFVLQLETKLSYALWEIHTE